MIRNATSLLLVVLTACSFRPPPRAPVADYDFGLEGGVRAEAPRIRARLVVADITAPPWLDTRSMNYRLAHDDPARLHSYANSRWAAPPVSLLSALLRGRVAEASTMGAAGQDYRVVADCVLRVELEEFGQLFDSAGSSQGIVRLRATLIRNPGRTLLAQRSFGVETSAPSPDAPGGVKALSQASRQIVEQIVAWIAETVAADAAFEPTIPVHASGRLLGVITTRDVAAALARAANRHSRAANQHAERK